MWYVTATMNVAWTEQRLGDDRQIDEESIEIQVIFCCHRQETALA
jgi:hypothetical protein